MHCPTASPAHLISKRCTLPRAQTRLSNVVSPPPSSRTPTFHGRHAQVQHKLWLHHRLWCFPARHCGRRRCCSRRSCCRGLSRRRRCCHRLLFRRPLFDLCWVHCWRRQRQLVQQHGPGTEADDYVAAVRREKDLGGVSTVVGVRREARLGGHESTRSRRHTATILGTGLKEKKEWTNAGCMTAPAPGSRHYTPTGADVLQWPVLCSGIVPSVMAQQQQQPGPGHATQPRCVPADRQPTHRAQQ